MDEDALTAREAEAWAGFRAVIDPLTPEQRERPDANPDGWSTKDVLWHIAYWWGDLSRMLDEMRDGTFVEPPDDDEQTNTANATVLETSRGMPLADVERGVEEARARMLSAWASLPQPDETARNWFVWETIEHYEEHLGDARRFAEEASREG